MASGNMKDIKRRIRSVESTMQITKAMELVASSKLRRAKERVEQTRPYFYALQETVSRVLRENHFSNVYTEQRTVRKKVCLSSLQVTAAWQAAIMPACSSSQRLNWKASRYRL